MQKRVLHIISFVLVLFVLSGTGISSFCQSTEIKKEKSIEKEQETSAPETQTLSVRDYVTFGNVHFEITGPNLFIFSVGDQHQKVPFTLKNQIETFTSYLDLLFSYYIVKQAP